MQFVDNDHKEYKRRILMRIIYKCNILYDKEILKAYYVYFLSSNKNFMQSKISFTTLLQGLILMSSNINKNI